MDFKTIFGGAAILSILAFAWNQIKYFYRKIFGLAIKTVDLPNIESYMPYSLLLYLEKNFDRVSKNKMAINSTQHFIKKDNKEKFVAWETIPHDILIYRKGWRFIVFNVTKHYPQLFYVRGTFNIDTLVKDAIHYKESLDTQENNRFFIKKIISGDEIDIKGKKYSHGEMSVSNSSEGSFLWISFNPSIFRTINYKNEEIVISREDELLIDKMYINDERQKILDELNFWTNNEKWYINKTIPWKRGYLFHGSPGTGKSSFVKALAQKLRIPLYVIDLSSMDNYYLQETYANNIKHNLPCIVLYEDIDAVFNGRNNVNKKDGFKKHLTFDMFLNVIDGVETSGGVITIITTNDLSKVDEALKDRKGRIDKCVKFDLLSQEGKLNIANRILNNQTLVQQVIESTNLEITPAAFTEQCIQLALLEQENNENNYN